jgi:hypothetical protein
MWTAWIVVRYILAMSAHSGLMFHRDWDVSGVFTAVSRHHYGHHLRVTGNYGVTPFWDVIMGTTKDAAFQY